MKNKKTYYGFKMHALAGAVSKVILHVCTTAANVHDSRALEWVLNEEEDAGRTLYADSAYSGKNLEELTRSFNVIPCFCEKRLRERPVDRGAKEVESQEIKDSLSHRAHLRLHRDGLQRIVRTFDRSEASDVSHLVNRTGVQRFSPTSPVP